MFSFHSLFNFLIICKYLCNLTYWYVFCLFFPRIPNINKGSLIALCVSNIFFMLPWQFAQFVLLTQVRSYLPLCGLFVYFKQIDYFVQTGIEFTIILMLPFQPDLLSGKIHPIYHTSFFLVFKFEVASFKTHSMVCTRTKKIPFSLKATFSLGSLH